MPPEVANACETCIANKACAPVGACIANRDCLGIAECVDTNTTPDRIAACASDAGLPLWNPATQALATCTDECGIHENWTCVGHVVWSKAESVPIKVRVHVIDGTSFAGIGGVTVKLCEVTDTSCVNPSDTETSDTDGYVTMTVKQLLGPFGPTGYFDVSGASVYPELVFWSFPLSVASQTGTVPTISVNAFNAFETLFNVPSDDTRGHVFAAAYDCRANPASNVRFKIDSQDPEIKTLYVQGASFSAMATSTDRSGLAGFFDVPKGGLTLTETPVGTNLSSSVSFFVRPMTLSAVYALPQPP